MTILTVYIGDPERTDSRLPTLPFEVFSTLGVRLGKGTASPGKPAKIKLRDERATQSGRVYVSAKLPNGKQVQEVAELLNGHGEVTLLQSIHTPSDWLEWLKPFRSLEHLNASVQFKFSSDASQRRVGEVWRMVWALNNGKWEASDLEPLTTQKVGTIQQFWFDVPNRPHLLQIGGEDVAWRIISLPPGGVVRVALTPSDQEIGNSMDITIGSWDPDNELIMSYLARGAMEQVTSLVDAWQTADQMLPLKDQDPVGAVSCAYVLLKLRRLEQHRGWMDNLVTSFPHMADAAIVSAAFLLQDEFPDESLIRDRIKQALENGLPVFTLGATLLVETMAAIHCGEEESAEFKTNYLKAQTYAQAICTHGTYFAFYATNPRNPSKRPTYGVQNAPRSTPRDWVDELKALRDSFRKLIATQHAGYAAQFSLDIINREARVALNIPEMGAAELKVSLKLEVLDEVRANQAAVIISGEH